MLLRHIRPRNRRIAHGDSSPPGGSRDSRYPPHVLREYAVVADGERAALVGPSGEIAWMCAPRWHSPALFDDLLGGPGVYAITPVGRDFVWGGHYDEGTLIWNTRWVTTEGIVCSREALAAPAAVDTAVLLRRVRAEDAPATLRVVLSARGDFGRDPMRDVAHDGKTWTARTGRLWLRWSGVDGVRVDERGVLVTQLQLTDGEQRDLVLEVSEKRLSGPPVQAQQEWTSTEEWWRGAVPELEGVLAPRDARHGYAVMRGLTSSTHGMVAAATLGLPEEDEEDRNYDYRYCWIRDQCYAGQAAAAAGRPELLDSAVTFISERVLEDGPMLEPAYTVDGRRVPDERKLDHLPGYPGALARSGNRANKQFQLDALGEVLLLMGTAAGQGRIDADSWRAVEAAAETVRARWHEPDAGIWELEDRFWTHSRLTCVAGLDSVARYAPASLAEKWRRLSGHLLAEVSSSCVHEKGFWKRSPDDDGVDASLLLACIRGALPPDDPRSVATNHEVVTDLSKEGYVYRFRHGDRPLQEAEGAFLMCGFLMALSEHLQGRHVEARSWFERNRAACGPPGLFTEEYDTTERQLRGNIPQVFVHALLLESAARLGERGQGR